MNTPTTETVTYARRVEKDAKTASQAAAQKEKDAWDLYEPHVQAGNR